MDKRHVGILLLTSLLTAALHAWDFGLITRQYAGYNINEDAENKIDYKGSFIPRFSLLISDTGSFFTSASMTIGVDDEFYYVPELLRTEFSMSFGALGVSAGRIHYTDPLAFIADGLFDGFRLTYASSAGRFGFGGWYTGYQYKTSANIQMTPAEQESYNTAFDYGDFLNTYFAPSRVLASLDWEHPSVGELVHLRAALTGQYDLTEENEKLNTEYITLKAGIPLGRLLFEAGGCIEAIQINSGAASSAPISIDDYAIYIAYAGEFGIFWTPPGKINSRLSLTGKVTSGYGGEDSFLTVFIPITTKYYGEIFQARITALSVFALNYTVRLVNTFGVSLTGSYFMRNDTETANSYPVSGEGEGGRLLGAEFFMRLVISPASDLQFNIGGGAYMPSLGDNWPDSKPIWRMEMTFIYAAF
jgi:hypothetical protein